MKSFSHFLNIAPANLVHTKYQAFQVYPSLSKFTMLDPKIILTPIVDIAINTIPNNYNYDQRSQITYFTNSHILEFAWNPTDNHPVLDDNGIYYNVTSESIDNDKITIRQVLRELKYNNGQITLDWAADFDEYNPTSTVDEVLDSPISTVLLNQMTISRLPS